VVVDVKGKLTADSVYFDMYMYTLWNIDLPISGNSKYSKPDIIIIIFQKLYYYISK
jgi:hypothetical protein